MKNAILLKSAYNEFGRLEELQVSRIAQGLEDDTLDEIEDKLIDIEEKMVDIAIAYLEDIKEMGAKEALEEIAAQNITMAIEQAKKIAGTL